MSPKHPSDPPETLEARCQSTTLDSCATYPCPRTLRPRNQASRGRQLLPGRSGSPSDFWSLWQVLLVFVPDVGSLLAVLTITPLLLGICWLVVATRSEQATTSTPTT